MDLLYCQIKNGDISHEFSFFVDPETKVGVEQEGGRISVKKKRLRECGKV